ncbi:phenylalanine--tRNA ligase subunit beta [Candidatus Annandia adelgestsuga]|uniref:phenylalanine--tRNA ligase subunit beta n=1 Tax=Candidatus Annandia adelgestsuga TaxID=1302411 RepID=UPI000F7F46B4|nr:phenylalanine--tRNA ligase subunit beta [Candidatus Annandia adelgestsuga]
MLKILKKKKNINYFNKICSFSDIGLKKIDNKIIELDNSIPTGINMNKFFNFDNYVIHINTNFNRFDHLSIIGIANDLSILDNLSIRKKKKYIILNEIKDDISIKIFKKKYCPIIISVIIKNINIKCITPKWIQKKIYSYGISSENIINNIINYLIIELGLPLYSFDLDCIDSFINIKMSKKNDLFNIYKNKKIKLKKNTLIIKDKSKILSLAGICINPKVKISNKSKNILLLCSIFNSKYIIGKKEIYKIKNNLWNIYSSKNVDFSMIENFFMKAIYFIKKNCKGKIGLIKKEINKKLMLNNKIKIKIKKINKIIGINISKKKIIKILKKIGCDIIFNIKYWYIIIPNNRKDILIKENIVREIIKFYGYNNIPIIPIKNNLLIKKNKNNIKKINFVKNFLLNKGYYETINYSFTDPKLQSMLFPKIIPLKINNYISKDMSVMRTTMLNGLISTLLHNQNRQKKSIKLFEYGTCFIPKKKNLLLVNQINIISGLLNGNNFNKNWIIKSRCMDFYDIKGDVESILDILNFNYNIKFLFNNKYKCLLHPGQSSIIHQNNKIIGFLGVLHPKLQKKLNIINKTMIFELFYDKILLKNNIKYKKFSKFPLNNRNINIIINKDILSEDVILFCKNITKKIINVELIDVYNDNIEKNKKSITLNLVLQSKKKTLEDNQINKIIQKCLILLKNKFNAYLKNKI